MEYYLFASNDCNLGCKYCSVMRENINGIPITPAFSDMELLNFVKYAQEKENDQSIDIIFFGGEPTLNYKYIYGIIDTFNNIGNNYIIRYFLHTNGLLLDKIDTQYLKQLYQIILSVNYEMIDKENLNNNYFSKIIKNISFVRSLSQVNLLGRLTITENVSLYTNVLQICDFFDTLYWQIENKHSFDNFNKFYNNYLFELNLLWKYWLKYFKNGILLNFIPFTHYLNILLRNNSIISPLCGYNIDCVYIRNDGKCFSCPEEMDNNEYSVGDIKQKVLKFNTNNQFKICGDCSFSALCHGRCGRMHKSFTEKHQLEYCELNKIMFRLFEENKADIETILNANRNYRKQIESTCFYITECIP